MIRPGILVNLLLEAAQGTERFYSSVAQVELPLGYVSRVIRDRVGHVISGHSRDREYRYRSGTIKVDRLFVSGGELTVQVPWIPPVRRDLFHGYRYFF